MTIRNYIKSVMKKISDAIQAEIEKNLDRKSLKESLKQWVEQGNKNEDRQKAANRILRCHKRKMKTLSLASFKLTAIPSCIKQLPDLEKLYLNENNLSDLPAEIANLTNLSTIRIDGNSHIKQIPSCLGKLEKLKILDAADCSINNIDTLKKIQSPLQMLNLRNNDISGDLQPLAHLKTLTYLSIFGNEAISELPKELLDFPNLKELLADQKLKQTNPSIFEKVKTRKKISDTSLLSLLNKNDKIRALIDQNNSLLTFIYRLNSTVSFKYHPKIICDTMTDIIIAMEQNKFYKDDCNLCFDEATTACEDRALFYFLLMTIKKDLAEPNNSSSLEQVFQYAKTCAMIEDCISTGEEEASKTKSNKSEEEIAFSLAYLENMKDILQISIPKMRFKGYTGLSNRALETHKQQLLAKQDHLAYQKIIDDELLRSLPSIKEILDPIAEEDRFSVEQLEEESSQAYQERLFSLRSKLLEAQIEVLDKEVQQKHAEKASKKEHTQTERSHNPVAEHSDTAMPKSTPRKRTSIFKLFSIKKFFKSIDATTSKKKTKSNTRIQSVLNTFSKIFKRTNTNRPSKQ